MSLNVLNLGETELFEVWCIPTDRENYYDYILKTYRNLVSAQEYCNEMKSKMHGTMEIVRVRTVRQLMAAVP